MAERRGVQLAGAAGAGALIGLAGAIRFSEVMFLVPAAIGFAFARRWGAGVLLAAAGAMSYIALICLGDWLYWGSPFYSGRHIVQFTLLDRLSSRGYQPWHYYLSYVLVWSNPFAVAAVAAAMIIGRGAKTYAALWIGIPMLLLSLLPHKEPRYLLPILPFWSAVAAFGAWQAIDRLKMSPRKELLSLAFLSLLIAGALVEFDRFRFRRSSDAVTTMQFVVSHQPRAIAFEESWTGGGWLYTGGAKLIDVPPLDAPPEALGAITAVCADTSVEWAVLRNRRASNRAADALKRCGFSAVAPEDLPAAYLVFARR